MGCCRCTGQFIESHPVADGFAQTKAESKGIAIAGCCGHSRGFTRSFAGGENKEGAGSSFSFGIPHSNAKAEEGIAVPSYLCRQHPDARAETDPAGHRDPEDPEGKEVCNAFDRDAGRTADSWKGEVQAAAACAESHLQADACVDFPS